MQQPTGLDELALLSRVDPAKDVDGLHPMNLGWLVLGRPAPVSYTHLDVYKRQAYDVAVAGWMGGPAYADTSDGTGFPRFTGATYERVQGLSLIHI